MSVPPASDLTGMLAPTLRKLDKDRYFASLMLPPPHQPAVQSLWAFAAEIAAIRERVSEPPAGEIRLQWWKDALEGKGHGDVSRNPLAETLLRTIEKHALSTMPLIRMIEARRFDLYQDPMPDMHTFEGYAGETVSILFQYAAQILCGTSDVPGDAAGHLGVAEALVGHVRAFGFNAAQGRIFLPIARFASAGISEREILSGQRPKDAQDVLETFVADARTHFESAQGQLSALPKEARLAFATLALIKLRLQKMPRQIVVPYATSADIADWRKLWAMFMWGLRNG